MIPAATLRPADIPQDLFDSAKTLARGAENAPDLAFGLVGRVLREVAVHPNPKRAAEIVCELLAVERSALLAEEAKLQEQKPRRGGKKGFRSGGIPKPIRRPRP